MRMVASCYKDCESCGRTFKARNAERRFCSLRCYGRSKVKEMPTKECAHCGRTFAKNRDHSYALWNSIRFCSYKCNGAARTRHTATCEQCNKVFETNGPSQPNRYCSRACYWRSMRSSRFPTARAGNFTWTDKRKILERDGYQCQRCGSAETPEVDHIVPCHLGGTNDLENGQVLCRPCHREKTNAELRAAFSRAA